MSRWEDEFLADQMPTAAPAPMKPVEPKPKARPMFVSPAAMVTKSLSRMGQNAVDAGKAIYVKLPCFTC
jgi:hypothetical protein